MHTQLFCNQTSSRLIFFNGPESPQQPSSEKPKTNEINDLTQQSFQLQEQIGKLETQIQTVTNESERTKLETIQKENWREYSKNRETIQSSTDKQTANLIQETGHLLQAFAIRQNETQNTQSLEKSDPNLSKLEGLNEAIKQHGLDKRRTAELIQMTSDILAQDDDNQVLDVKEKAAIHQALEALKNRTLNPTSQPTEITTQPETEKNPETETKNYLHKNIPGTREEFNTLMNEKYNDKNTAKIMSIIVELLATHLGIPKITRTPDGKKLTMEWWSSDKEKSLTNKTTTPENPTPNSQEISLDTTNLSENATNLATDFTDKMNAALSAKITTLTKANMDAAYISEIQTKGNQLSQTISARSQDALSHIDQVQGDQATALSQYAEHIQNTDAKKIPSFLEFIQSEEFQTKNPTITLSPANKSTKTTPTPEVTSEKTSATPTTTERSSVNQGVSTPENRSHPGPNRMSPLG